jgi:hypothetical protein
MKYSDIRDDIRSGDIIALSHSSWSSYHDLEVQAVRTATQSEYSHICVAWVFANRVFVIEAVNPLVRIIPLSNMKEEGFYWIQSQNEMSNEELEFAMGKVGLEGYSKLQAIAAQFNMLDIGEDRLWECAELVIAMRKLSGWDLGNKATPAACIKEALRQGYSLKFVEA